MCAPLYSLVDPPPLRVVGLQLEASATRFGLLCHCDGARIDDVAALARSQRGVDQLLVLLAAPAVGASEGLAGTHHHLGTEERWNSSGEYYTISGSVKVYSFLLRINGQTRVLELAKPTGEGSQILKKGTPLKN